MRRILFALPCALLLGGLLAAPAQARWVEPTPALNTPVPLQEFVAASGILASFPADDPWVPSGTKIRDTGFTPNDGLNFLNYANKSNGLPNEINMFYLGVPDKNPVNLRDADVVSLFGKKACVDRKFPCVLTLTAQEWKRDTNAAMEGGHCWGIADTVAQIYNGVMPLSKIGSAKSVYATTWSNALTRQIARAWSSQHAINLSEYSVSPKRAITMLRKNMKKGFVPYTLGMYSTTGDGHGVTPVALYKIAPHKYKIAIYDNNYPGRLRAMQVDTKANTMAYEMFTVPGAPPVLAIGRIDLVPMGDLEKPLPCPWCGGSTPAQVHVQPVPTQDDVKVSVTTWDGTAIKGLVHHRPTSPSGLVGIREFGKYEVPTGKNFAITIDAKALTEPVETTVRVIESGVSFIVEDIVLTPGADVTVYLNPKEGYATVKSTKDTSFNLIGLDTTGGVEWQMEYGTVLLAKGGEATVTVDDEKFNSTLSMEGVPTQNLQVLAIYGDSKQSNGEISEVYSQGSGGVTYVSFKKWNPQTKGNLVVRVSQLKDSPYVPVKMSPLLG